MDKISYQKSYNKAYYEKNKERERKRSKSWRDLNIEKARESTRKWYQANGAEYRKKNIDRIRKSAREYARKHRKEYYWDEAKRDTQRRYRKKHKEKVAEKRRKYRNKRLKTDINYRLIWLLRSRTAIAIKRQLGSKAYKTVELLGCSVKVAREYIEKQFKDGMSWENHGKLWEIDHKIPVSSFDLTKPEEQKKAFHYTNLQPLNWQINRSKSNRMMI